jgi:hypothetical protein
MKPGLSIMEESVEMGLKEPDIFWIHIEGRGVSNGAPRADLMAKFLETFDSLVNHVAIYRGYISPANPAGSFHVFYAGLRPGGSAGLGLQLKRPRNLTRLFPIPDPVDKVNADVAGILGASAKKDGHDYFASTFQDPYQRITIYNDIRKMCSNTRRRVWITRTGLKEPWEKSSLFIKLDESVKENVLSWTTMEIERGIPFITGYFTGFRLSRSQFWILLDDDMECVCGYSDERIGRIVDGLRKYDKIKVIGDVVVKPGKPPVVKTVVDIINLDVAAEEETDGMGLNDEYDADFLHDIDEGERDIKEGRVLSEEEFWKSVNDEPKE